MSADLNLLFGVLALQADLLDAARFAEACSAWAARKDTPLADLLVERGWLTEEERGHVEFLLQRKLKKHGGDARASLAEVTNDEVHHSLASVADPDLQESLAALPTPASTSPGPTMAHQAQGRGRYTLTRLHATGGVGQVWLARDTELGRDVALKELHPHWQSQEQMRRRFLAEARVTGKLEHPGVVPVYDLVERNGEPPCYAMRLIRGRTLAEAVADYHRKSAAGQAEAVEFRELLTAFVTVCQTLAYAHSRGVIHRDLKPANVVMGPYGEVLVLDWGLAKVLDDAEPTEEESVVPQPEGVEATQQGGVLGTPGYMPPEQAGGHVRLVDRRSDVFGLGSILYEVLTGRPPFPGPKALEQARACRPAPPRSLAREVPKALEAVCLKAMRRLPEERYQSAQEVAKEVERWLADEPVSAWREPLRVRAGRWSRRNQALVGAVAAGVLVAFLLGGAGAFWAERQRGEREAEEARQDALRRQGVEAALEEVKRLQQAARWLEARATLAQAEARLEGGGPEELVERLAQARRDLDLVARLDAVRQVARLHAERFRGREFGERTEPNKKYAEVFAEAELGRAGEDTPAVVGDRVRASAVRGVLVAALDDWALCAMPADRLAWVLAVARHADPDPWRDRARDPRAWNDTAVLERLAREAPLSSLPPSFLAALGTRLREGENAVAVLRAAQKRLPGDFWVNLLLGDALLAWEHRWEERGYPWEAAEYFRVALAVRPGAAIAHSRLGWALLEQDKDEEAAEEFNAARRLDRNDDFAALGFVMLAEKRKQDEARASAIKAKAADARVLTEGAIKWLDLGGQDEAIEAFRGALRALPNDPLARAGFTLAEEGKAGQALAATRDFLALLPAGHPQRHAAQKLLRRCERVVALEKRLPAVIRGEDRPADAIEQLALAALCRRPEKRLYAASARFYADAFAAKPNLATLHHYHAARAAAMTGCGEGYDGAPGEESRARFRKQALGWLRADLALHAKERHWRFRRRVLLPWLKDPDLAGVREPAALARLSEAERQEWKKLWSEVEGLLAKAGAEKAGK
jgi:serine/threonine-protein kinase